MTWELVWKTVFIGFSVTFAVMSVFVTILGARDVKRLLAGLRSQEIDREEDAKS